MAPTAFRRASLLLVLTSAIVGARDVRASPMQGGYTDEKRPEVGLRFPRARDYEAIPVPPDEPWIVLHFAQKSAVAERGDQVYRAEVYFVSIERTPVVDPELHATASAPADSAGTKANDGAAADVKPPDPPIDTLESYFEKEQKPWVLGKGKPVEQKPKDRALWALSEYPLRFRKVPERMRDEWIPRGAVYAWKSAERTLVMFGYCAAADFDEQSKIWRYTADHMKISEPEEAPATALKRHYARLTLAHPEFRIAVRSKLVKGWKSEDTDHFVVIYDTVDQPLMRKICRDIELLRREYEKLFPPVKDVDAVSTVRICKDRDEYVSYSGLPSTAGFWNYKSEELVLYDADPKFVSDSGTFIALYHEAFHQYIHYSVGELPPHSWFNEGHGDYFSGAEIKDGKVRRIGTNPWRLRTIQAAISMHKFVPWRDIVHYEKAEYYANPVVCYAQGWSMIYFLRTADVVKKRPEWARILPLYFDTLKEAYAAELAKLESAGKKDDDKARDAAGVTARQQALDTAFAGVDFEEIEEAWASYVTGL